MVLAARGTGTDAESVAGVGEGEGEGADTAELVYGGGVEQADWRADPELASGLVARGENPTKWGCVRADRRYFVAMGTTSNTGSLKREHLCPLDAAILRGEYPPPPPIDAIAPPEGASYYWDSLAAIQASGLYQTGHHEPACRMAARAMGAAIASARKVARAEPTCNCAMQGGDQ